MDFFQAQDNARKKSGRLVFLYIAAVIGIVITIYAVMMFAFNYSSQDEYGNGGIDFWQPDVFLGTAAITIAVIGLGSLFKTLSLRSGGGVVARSVGGELVSPNTSDPQRRRLLNIVEEMSIAAGIRMPEVYVLPEQGINAFAAGYSPDDAAVAVTQGTLDTLSRDELQGVIAHEFSHILNGDMRLNIRLIGLLFGILLLTIIGRVVLRAGFMSGGGRRSSKDKGGGGAAIALLGLALVIVGYIGVFFGRLIQAAVSRQREFLADASAVQFTRNPDGIAGALKKIGLAASGSQIDNAHATETSHMFFASALRSSFGGLFATHPPLAERIKAIEPTFDGDFGKVRKSIAEREREAQQQAEQARSRAQAQQPPPVPAAIQAGAFLAALAAIETPNPQAGADILGAIPEFFRDAAHDPERARSVLLAMLYARDNAQAAAKQDAVVARVLTTTERVVFIDAVRQLDTVPPWTRIALGDIALASIRHLEIRQTNSMLEAVDAFIEADGEVSLHEYAMRKVIHRNLSPTTVRQKMNVKTCDAAAAEIAVVVSVLAHAGDTAPAAVQHAFDTGAEAIRSSQAAGVPDLSLALVKQSDLNADAIITALDRLDQGTPVVKQAVLGALVRTASADGKIEPAEQDLLRAVAAALNCPAPVL